MNILVAGDEKGVALLLNDLVREGYRVEWEMEVTHAVKKLGTKGMEFDLVVLCPGAGLADADEIAMDMKMSASNMPIIIVMKEGVTDDGASAGIALGNIDKIVPNLTADEILGAFDQLRGAGSLW